MKKRLSIFVFLTLFIVMNSCKDFIYNDIRGTQNLDVYFDNASECRTFVDGLYKRMIFHDDWWQLLCPRLTNETATDDAWYGNTQDNASDYYACAHYDVTPMSMCRMNELWRFRFENISNCNHAIARIPESSIDDALKPVLVAEAKFCRAYNLLELVCNFGGFPLITEPVGTSQLNKERATAEEVYAQIISDLESAAASLDYLDPKAALGRATKGSCEALLARAYLFKGDYTNAFKYADNVIKCGKYSLTPNFIDVWSVNNHNGVESIFEAQTTTDRPGGVGLGNKLSTVAGARGQKVTEYPSGLASDVMDGWGWCMPTSDLENCYLSENDDIRRKSTITKFYEAVYGDEILNPNYYFNPEANKSQRVIRKYYIPIETRRLLQDKYQQAPLNIIALRLAEMYLTRAEAAYHQNNPSQALSDMNLVRDRVSLDPKTGLTGNDLLYAIWKERRMELAFEGIRLYDLRRQIDPVSGKPMIAVVMGPNGTFVKYNTGPDADPDEAGNTRERQDKGIMFDESKHLLWPIPQADIDRSMGVIKQNPGYN